MENRCFNDKMRKVKEYVPESASCRIKLDANESFVELPDYIRQSMIEALVKLPFNRYPDPLASKVCARFGALIRVDPRYITAGNGSDELIGLIIHSMTEHGDKLLVSSPDFSMYGFYAQLSELNVVLYDKMPDLKFDVNVFAETVRREAPRIVILSNPCSPSGIGVRRRDMKKLLESCPDPIFVVDEAYMDFWGESILEDAVALDNVIVLKTCSKAIGIAALRLGFAICNEALTGFLRAAKSPYNVNAATQAFAECLLREPCFINKCTERIRLNTEGLVKGLKHLEGIHPASISVFPTVTNFVFARFSDPNIHQKLVERGILVRKMEPYLRITAGEERDNRELVNAVAAILHDNKQNGVG